MNRMLFWLVMTVGAWAAWRRAFARPYLHLKDKVVLITGASSGIGRAAANAFAAQGAKLVLTARRADLLEAAKAEIAAVYGVEALVIPADVSDEADRARLIQTTLAHFGRVDVLVNNAGIGVSGALADMPEAEVARVLDVNLRAAALLTRAVLPHMLAQQAGHIVNVSSAGALAPMPGQNVYAAAKAGMIGLSDALRRELSGTGVNISTLLPGFTDTPMLGDHASRDETERDLRAAGILLPGIVLDDPAVVGGAIVNAVRYNRREWITGGPGIVLACWLGRWFPGVLDVAMRFITRDDLPHRLAKATQGAKAPGQEGA